MSFSSLLSISPFQLRFSFYKNIFSFLFLFFWFMLLSILVSSSSSQFLNPFLRKQSHISHLFFSCMKDFLTQLKITGMEKKIDGEAVRPSYSFYNYNVWTGACCTNEGLALDVWKALRTRSAYMQQLPVSLDVWIE